MARNQDPTPETKTQKDWKFILIISLLVFLLLMAVGAGAYYIGSTSSAETKDQTDEPEEEKKSSGFSFGSDNYLGPLVELEDFVVNITDDKQTRYLKVAITMEAANKKTKNEVDNRLPQLRDAIIFQISGKTHHELRDLQGKKQLQAELIKSLNEVLNEGRIERLFFTEFVVQ
ncbi:MAG: flagellar basal body-associated FliL family protein [Desulfovermiculus sp.]